MRVVDLVLASCVALSCGPPGVVVEFHNATSEDIIVRQGFNDGSTTTHPVAPGEHQEFGPALSWHVNVLGTVFEVQHPGDEFGRSRAFGQQLFRFQAQAPGCLFVLLPEQRPPVSEFPQQPRGYPLGDGRIPCKR
jgi:hypothetical protein